MSGALSRPWLERPAPTHPLLEQLADSRAFIGVQPGPVFHFDGGTIGFDLRFGDPDDEGRAVEAIAEGFAELGCTGRRRRCTDYLRRLLIARAAALDVPRNRFVSRNGPRPPARRPATLRYVCH